MLLTRSRLCPGASPGSSLHLHVLSTPPAFVLSQDQTLREELLEPAIPKGPTPSRRAVMTSKRHRVHRGAAVYDGFILRPLAISAPASRRRGPRGRTWTHTGSLGAIQVRMLLSFQRPSRVPMEGTPPGPALLWADWLLTDRTCQYSAPSWPFKGSASEAQ